MATHNLELMRRSEYRTIELNHGRIVFDSGDAIRAAARAARVASEEAR